MECQFHAMIELQQFPIVEKGILHHTTFPVSTMSHTVPHLPTLTWLQSHITHYPGNKPFHQVYFPASVSWISLQWGQTSIKAMKWAAENGKWDKLQI